MESLLEFGQFGVVLVRFFSLQKAQKGVFGREVAFESAEREARS